MQWIYARVCNGFTSTIWFTVMSPPPMLLFPRRKKRIWLTRNFTRSKEKSDKWHPNSWNTWLRCTGAVRVYAPTLGPTSTHSVYSSIRWQPGKNAKRGSFQKTDVCRKIVTKCTQISAKKRYLNCHQIYKQLDAVLPEDTPADIRFLRKIPGFRSATLWKMILAVCLYLFALLAFLSLA